MQATQVYAGLKLWPTDVTARLVEAQLAQDGTCRNAAAVFAERADEAEATTDTLPVADLSATAFAPWVNEPRDPDGRWTTGGGRSTEPEDPDTSSPPPGAPGPHAPDGTPIELASFKRRGRLHAIAALLKGVARLWRRWRPGELDEPEPIAPDAGPPAQQDPSSSPAGSKPGDIPNHPEANRPAEMDPEPHTNVSTSVQGKNPKIFTPEQNAAMEKLFKGGGKEGSVQGAQRLLEQIDTGEFELPTGVSKEMLETYRDIALSAIARGRDKIGVQALRLKAIDRILRR